MHEIPFLADAAEIVYSHHERYDGAGYPRGFSLPDNVWLDLTKEIQSEASMRMQFSTTNDVAGCSHIDLFPVVKGASKRVGLACSSLAQLSGSQLDVAEESWGASMLPVFQVIGLDSKSRARGAEESMLRGIDHNGSMATPYGQVSRLRVADAAKVLGAVIELGGVGIAVGKTGLLVDGVNYVRTVPARARRFAGLQCDACNDSAFVGADEVR